MKKSLLLCLGLVTATTAINTHAEEVTLNGKTYTITTLIDRDLGPGVHYTRLRLPAYPLNVNMLRIDVTNPYNSVEVTQGSDKLYSTELLTNAAKRQSRAGHVALAGANANFWCVSGQPPYSDQMIGVTYNGNLKNGKVITETNCKNDKYNGGLKHTGITGITTDNKVYSSNNFKWEGWMTSDKTGDLEIYQCNKIVRDGEIGLYNSFYPTSRTFRCCDMYAGDDGKNHFQVVQNCATEVYLKFDQGQDWSAGDDMTFTVTAVKTGAGNGTLGSADMALVGRGANAEAMAKLAAGDKVTVRYNWIAPDGTKVKMNNLVGGNAQVMVDGELTTYNTSETYNSQVYSRTGYGCDSEGKTLYIIVIDKATDPVYGTSAGCSTTVMCDIAKHYGCTSMTNFDAGGSAMMLVGDKIINKTTESTPRSVANGMIAYSIAPADNNVARLEFYDYELKSPIYATSTPRIIAFNQYGDVLDDNFSQATLSCPAEAGTCEGSSFTAGGTGMTSTLTATYNGVSVTKPITIVQAQLALRVNPLLIDLHRVYPIEVTATVDENLYNYNPASINWTVGDNTIVNIDHEGKLSGLKEGSTTITAQIGDFTDVATVTVECSKSQFVPLDAETIDPATWKLGYTSTKNGVITPLGNQSGMGIDYQISSTRGPKVTVTKDITLYSLPDAIQLTVNPGNATVKGLVIGMQPRNQSRAVTYTYDQELTQGQDNTITIPVDNFSDSADLLTYPIDFKNLAFTLGGSTGTYHIDVPSMHAVYNNFSGVETIDADCVNATDAFYNLKGEAVNGSNLTPGLYIRVSQGAAQKVLVK